ncbi:MAG: putative quinol monooxygenase [Chloroflexota bacterium]
MLIVAGKIPIQPEKRAEAMAVTTIMAKATQAEEGCIEYHFYSNVEDPNTFLVFEKWETADALKAHFETPHMAEFRSKMPNLAAGPSDVWQYEVSNSSKI